MKTRVYVENNDSLLVGMFKEGGFEVVPSIFACDLLCLEGGADVTPALYGEENTASGCSGSKDIHSLGLISIAKMLSLPIVGICRGGQILNVVNGGSMIQHVENHNRSHTLEVEGLVYDVSSGHHQAMLAQPSYDECYEAGDGVPEVIRYGNLLCFQPHPEWVGKGHSCRTLFFKMLDKIV